MVNSAAPSMICIKQSKGSVFSINPSPASTDETVISPVDFLMMVFMSTELGTYSRISMMMCGMDFSSSVLPELFEEALNSFTPKGAVLPAVKDYNIAC